MEQYFGFIEDDIKTISIIDSRTLINIEDENDFRKTKRPSHHGLKIATYENNLNIINVDFKIHVINIDDDKKCRKTNLESYHGQKYFLYDTDISIVKIRLYTEQPPPVIITQKPPRVKPLEHQWTRKR